MRSKKLFIGVTGGIGSGKSEVCKYLDEFGCIVIISDNLAKTLYKTNKLLKNKLVKEFGSNILDASGEIDQRKLKDLVFCESENQKNL